MNQYDLFFNKLLILSRMNKIMAPSLNLNHGKAQELYIHQIERVLDRYPLFLVSFLKLTIVYFAPLSIEGAFFIVHK